MRLDPNLAGRPTHSTYTDCPCCGYNQSLSVTAKAGKQLFYCHAGCDQADLIAVMHCSTPRHELGRGITPRKDDASIKQYAQSLWDSSTAATGTLVEWYLRSRGIHGCQPPSLRFLSSHRHKPSGKNFPVMLAAVTDCAGQFRAVHRTYLTRDGVGKAPVEPVKMTLGQVGGFSCHLASASTTLAVSEGIETGLSIQYATGIPTWAALSAGGIRNLILPSLPLAAEIIIAADADPVGMRSASDAAMRWQREGRKVRIALPPLGQDFNDVIMARGMT